MENLFFQKDPLQDLLSSLNALMSTNESNQFITGHMVYNLVYTEILQTTTTLICSGIFFLKKRDMTVFQQNLAISTIVAVWNEEKEQ